MSVRVFLVDEHELVHRGVRDLLWAADDMVVVGEAATANETLEKIRKPSQMSPCSTCVWVKAKAPRQASRSAAISARLIPRWPV